MYYQDSNNRDSFDGFSLKQFSTMERLSIEALMQEIKPLITEIHAFEYRIEQSKINNTVWSFRTIGIPMNERKSKKFLTNSSP